jgi:hypothetical protein
MSRNGHQQLAGDPAEPPFRLVYTVEHFEQDLSGLNIRGQGQRADGSWYADWESEAANINEQAGKLTYIYTCQKTGTVEPISWCVRVSFSAGRRREQTDGDQWILGGSS